MENAKMLDQNNLHPHRGSDIDFTRKSWRANHSTWYYPLFVTDVRVLNLTIWHHVVFYVVIL